MVINIVCYFLIVNYLLVLVRNGNELIDYLFVNLNTFVLSNLHGIDNYHLFLNPEFIIYLMQYVALLTLLMGLLAYLFMNC